MAERVDFRKWKDGKWEMVEGKFSCSIYSILVYLSCVILCFLFNELIFINMIGALAGDIIGSVYEFNNIKTKEFPLFCIESSYTDDSIMTIAVADWLLHGGDLVRVMQYYGSKYPFPMGGYGARFNKWLHEKNPKPYNSWGNGSAMRVSPVGWYFDSLEETINVAEETAVVTHNHPEGIKGAQATASAIYLARKGKSKEYIRSFITDNFGYDLNRCCDDIRCDYKFDESCQGTVPEALIAFLESRSFEDAIRLAVSLGGDSDTLACITGGIAEAFIDIEFPMEYAARFFLYWMMICEELLRNL